jgi:hypothetical protein
MSEVLKIYLSMFVEGVSIKQNRMTEVSTEQVAGNNLEKSANPLTMHPIFESRNWVNTYRIAEKKFREILDDSQEFERLLLENLDGSDWKSVRPIIKLALGFNSQKIQNKIKKVIWQWLRVDNVQTVWQAIGLAMEVEDEDFRKMVVLTGMEEEVSLIREMAIELSAKVKDKKFKERVVREGLISKRSSIKIKAIELAGKIESEDADDKEFKKEIILEGWEKGDLRIKKLAVELDRSTFEEAIITEEEIKMVVAEGLVSESDEVVGLAIKLAETVKDKNFKKMVVMAALGSGMFWAEKNALRLTAKIGDNAFRKRIASLGMEKDDFSVKLDAVGLIKNEKESNIGNKIRTTILELLKSDNVMIAERVVELVAEIDDMELRKRVVKEGLKLEVGKIRWVVELAKTIGDKEFKKMVIKKGLNMESWLVQRVAIELSQGVDDANIQRTIADVLKKHFIQSNVNGSKTSIQRTITDVLKKHFIQSNVNGSKTSNKKYFGSSEVGDKHFVALVEEEFSGERVVTRIVSLENFLAWKRAFENYQNWSEVGFDYIPVEPILHFELRRDLTVRVYTIILDDNVGGLGLRPDNRIASVLEDLGIKYMDETFGGGYGVYFKKDLSGNPVLTEMPRQYVIDFQKAELIK